MTLEEWNYIYQKSTEVIKSKLKKQGVVIDKESFEEMALNITTEYFKEVIQNKKEVPPESTFSYLWALSKRTSLSWAMQLLDNDQPYTDKPKPLPINLTRLQVQTPLGHLVLATITSTTSEKTIQQIFHRFVRVRSCPATPSLISPYHSNLPVKDWIQHRLNDFNLTPKLLYFIYKWGIATDDFDPQDYGLYRTDKIIDTIQIIRQPKKQLLLNFL